MFMNTTRVRIPRQFTMKIIRKAVKYEPPHPIFYSNKIMHRRVFAAGAIIVRN